MIATKLKSQDCLFNDLKTWGAYPPLMDLESQS